MSQVRKSNPQAVGRNPSGFEEHENKFFFVSGDWEFSPTEMKATDYKRWSVKNWWAPIDECFPSSGSGKRSEEGEVAEFYTRRTWSVCLEPLNLFRWGIQQRRTDTPPLEIKSHRDIVEGVLTSSFFPEECPREGSYSGGADCNPSPQL